MEQHKTNRIRELLAASNDIYSKLHQYKDDLKDIHNSSNIDHNDIIDFADNITLTLSAPRLYRDGLPLIASHAPCPQFYEMRMGRLATFNSSSTVKQIQDIGNNKEELSIERKISIMQEKQERQISTTNNSNSNKRKRSDDIDLNEEKVDDRPVRRFKEDTIVAKTEVNVTNGTSSSTAIVSSSTTTATITKINNNSDISKAESKSNENNDTTKVIKAEASSVTNVSAPVQAPKRVINISFGLSDSDSD